MSKSLSAAVLDEDPEEVSLLWRLFARRGAALNDGDDVGRPYAAAARAATTAALKDGMV